MHSAPPKISRIYEMQARWFDTRRPMRFAGVAQFFPTMSAIIPIATKIVQRNDCRDAPIAMSQYLK